MKNRNLALIFIFTLSISSTLNAQQLQLKGFFDHPPKVNVLKYLYSKAEIEEGGDSDPEDLYFPFDDTYEDMKQNVTETDDNTETSKLLSTNEKIALYAYTSQYYGLVNTVLRGSNAGDHAAIKPFTNAISQALSKVEIYRGPVVRGIGKGKYLDKFLVGRTITEKAYVSATTDMDAGYTDRPVLLKIESKKGHLLNSFSWHPGELEVLFDKGTKFLVVGRSITKNKLVINLVEVN